ncbi:flagellar hook-length control protein FliK [Castellaniella hirudinis]|uniref:flagellar hook-length control protein FliK n=1 Tax=Castellaniella hirudinis TaxID=1144617 RepID=UPI0039C28AC1
MTMPVLPTASPNPTSADHSTRAPDAPAETASFSSVLSGQRGAAAAADAKPGADTRAAQSSDPEKPDPLGPDEALALILDAVGLPLMQAPADPAQPRQADAHPGRPDNVPAPAQNRAAQWQDLPARAQADATPQGKAEAPTTAHGHAAQARPQDPAAPLIAAAARAATQAQAQTPADARSAKRTETTPGEAPLRFSIATPAAAGRAPAGAAVPLKTTPTPQGAGGAPLAAAQAHPGSADGTAARAAATNTAATAGDLASIAAPGAVLLTPAATAGQAASAAAGTIQLNVPTPLHSPQWPQDVGRQLLSLTQAGATGTQTVMMHVNPPELGPVRITLHLGDSIQASFVSPHANVRQALENALPNLQQQLAQSGLSLGQANVSDQSAQQQFAQQGSGSANPDGAVFSLDGHTETAAHPLDVAAPAQRAIRPDSLVDTFA